MKPIWIVQTRSDHEDQLQADRYYTEKDGELVLINEEEGEGFRTSTLVKRYSKFGWLNIRPHVPLEVKLAAIRAQAEREAEIQTAREKLLQKRVSDFELSVRSAHCLRNMGITTLAELITRSPRDLLATPNFGKTSLREIQELLNNYGLQLAKNAVT
jgi:DNA-directed RNA polymerase alpha subunit